MKTRKIKEKIKKGAHILIKFLFFCDFKDYISKANDLTEKQKEKKKMSEKKN
jgi:hypothetical protein